MLLVQICLLTAENTELVKKRSACPSNNRAPYKDGGIPSPYINTEKYSYFCTLSTVLYTEGNALTSLNNIFMYMFLKYRSKSIRHWLQNTAIINAAWSSTQCWGMYTAHTPDPSLFTCTLAIQLIKQEIKTTSQWYIISTGHNTKIQMSNN